MCVCSIAIQWILVITILDITIILDIAIFWVMAKILLSNFTRYNDIKISEILDITIN